jgi:hypothetical protein
MMQLGPESNEEQGARAVVRSVLVSVMLMLAMVGLLFAWAWAPW